MNFLASKNISLACALFNGGFALHSFANSNWLLGCVCAIFCVFCSRNYLSARSSDG